MKIIVDAMGGDFAPLAPVKGALMAQEKYGVDIVLTGKTEEILKALQQCGCKELPKGMEIANATEVVEICDDPATAFKHKKDSSLTVGLNMLHAGDADGFVSAGSTGALLAGATLVVKRIRGLRRAALAPTIPTAKGKAVLIDCGANVECTAEYLLQFAYMGSFYAKRLMGIANPRVALLNNGAEETKGGQLQQSAYKLLKAAKDEGRLNFVGNIEGSTMFMGGADVVVTDGFSGNILLKAVEGTAQFMSRQIKGIFTHSLTSKLGYLLCRKGVEALKEQMDYRKVGGSMLVGISKPVIKAHGSSDAVAIRGAIRQAMGAVSSGFCDEIRANVSGITAARQEAEHVSGA